MVLSSQFKISKTSVSIFVGIIIVAVFSYTVYQILNPEVSREDLKSIHMNLLERAQELRQQAAEVANNCNEIYSELNEQLTCYIEESEEIKNEMTAVRNKITDIDKKLEIIGN